MTKVDIMDCIDKKVDSLKPEIIDFTKKLVAIPTVDPPGQNYGKIVELIEKKCREMGLSTKRIIVPKRELEKQRLTEPRINLLAEYNIGRRKTLHFNCHYDVVPASNKWKTNPFEPVVKKGKLFGRGSADMKADISAAIYGLKAIRDCGMEPKVNIQFSFTCDEEIGGELGAGYLVKKRLVKADYAIGEGSSKKFFSYGNKGILHVEIEVSGKSCHASKPFLGVNAFENMLGLTDEMRKLKSEIIKRKTFHNVKDKRERNATFEMGGRLQGGNAINMLPDKVVFSIDRRILPEETLEMAKKELVEAVSRAKKTNKQLRVKIRFISSHDPVVVDKKNPICLAIGRAIKRVYKSKAKGLLLTGATDLRYFTEKGIPAIGYSVEGENCHADDEHIYLEDLIKTTKVFANLFKELR